MEKETDYAQAIGVLREMEKQLISRDMWQRAMDAPGAAEAAKATGSGYDFASLAQIEAYEPLLQAKLAETYDSLYAICPEPVVIDILNLKYVYHNLKVAVKAAVSEHARQNSEGLYAAAARVEAKPKGPMGSDEATDYLTDARTAMEAAFELSRDPQAIDMTADRFMFAHMLSLAEGFGNGFILQYVRMMIDLHNLKLLMRVKNMQKGTQFLNEALIPGGMTDTDMMLGAYDKPFSVIAAQCYYKYFGQAVKQSEEQYEKTKNFSTLEKLTDNLLIAHTKNAKFIAFGPEPLFCYVLAVENEVRQLRILLTCKINGIPEETLRERVRDYYA